VIEAQPALGQISPFEATWTPRGLRGELTTVGPVRQETDNASRAIKCVLAPTAAERRHGQRARSASSLHQRVPFEQRLECRQQGFVNATPQSFTGGYLCVGGRDRSGATGQIKGLVLRLRGEPPTYGDRRQGAPVWSFMINPFNELAWRAHRTAQVTTLMRPPGGCRAGAAANCAQSLF
jgi:hypothetical protein